MNSLAIAVAAVPGPIGSLAMNFAPALAPAGIGLLVLAVLGTIVLVVGRDARRPAVAPPSRPAEVAVGERRRQPSDSNPVATSQAIACQTVASRP
jgi:hypothetical protein